MQPRPAKPHDPDAATARRRGDGGDGVGCRGVIVTSNRVLSRECCNPRAGDSVEALMPDGLHRRSELKRSLLRMEDRYNPVRRGDGGFSCHRSPFRRRTHYALKVDFHLKLSVCRRICVLAGSRVAGRLRMLTRTSCLRCHQLSARRRPAGAAARSGHLFARRACAMPPARPFPPQRSGLPPTARQHPPRPKQLPPPTASFHLAPLARGTLPPDR